MSAILARKAVVAGLLIVFLLVGLGIGYVAAPPKIEIKEVIVEVPPKPEVYKVVWLCPLTGVLGTYGENSKAATELAVKEVNEWLEKMKAPWRLEIIFEDTVTDPPTALAKLKTWHGLGVKFFIGPMSSGEVKACKDYADANKLLLISPSSTSPALSIPDDWIFRFCPDDAIQGPAIARMIWDAGVRHVIVTWRGDPWGDGLREYTDAAFVKLGGIIYKEYDIRYDPGAKDFPVEAAMLEGYVKALLDKGIPKKEIGILAISFEEITMYMEDAAAYPLLREILWFGSDGTVLCEPLVKHPIAAKFAADTKFINTITAPELAKYPRFDLVKAHVEKVLGRTPDPYAYITYDIVWTLAYAFNIVGYKPEEVRDILPKVVETWSFYHGASGPIVLNVHGDKAWSDYDLWIIMEVAPGVFKWEKVGIWKGGIDKITWYIPIY